MVKLLANPVALLRPFFCNSAASFVVDSFSVFLSVLPRPKSFSAVIFPFSFYFVCLTELSSVGVAEPFLSNLVKAAALVTLAIPSVCKKSKN